MKKIISLLLAAVMLVSCMFVLAGCGAPEDDGAQIQVYLGNVAYDFDPSDYYADSNAEQLMSLIYEPLFKLNKRGKLKNAMAEDYEINEEERKIVITLRESYWSDDRRVEAKDFVYAWTRRLLDPNNPNPAATLLFDIENAYEARNALDGKTISDVAVKSTDVYELTITYREGADPERLLRNLSSIATSPIREDVVGADGSLNSAIWSKTVNRVTNGPFEILLSDADSGEFSLVRNRGYHQPPSEEDYDNEVVPGALLSFLTPAGEEIAVSYKDLTDKVTFFMSEATLADRAANKDEAEVRDIAATYTYVFNLNKDLFKIKEVRQALSVAIDREAIVSAVVFGKAANGFISDSFGGSDENLIDVKGNTTKAKELLAGANLAGVNTSFTVLVADNEESKKIAELVTQCWNSLGYGINASYEVADVKIVPDSVFMDCGIQYAVKNAAYGDIDYDVIAVDWQTYTDDAFVALAGLASGYGAGIDFANGNTKRTNIAGWANTQYDEYVRKAYEATDDKTREDNLKAAEKLLCEEAAIVPIMFEQNFAFVSNQLRKVEFDGLGHYVFNSVKQKNYQDYIKTSEED